MIPDPSVLMGVVEHYLYIVILLATYVDLIELVNNYTGLFHTKMTIEMFDWFVSDCHDIPLSSHYFEYN